MTPALLTLTLELLTLCRGGGVSGCGGGGAQKEKLVRAVLHGTSKG